MSEHDIRRELAEPIVAQGHGVPERVTIALGCPECQATIPVDVVLQRDVVRTEWSPVDDVECPSCYTVLPLERLLNLEALDEAVQERREFRV